MIEHLNYNDLAEREVFLYWNSAWYRLPFYLLEDIAGEWNDSGREEESAALSKWIKDHRYTHKNSEAIPMLKDLLEREMPLMIAYRYFTDQPLTTEPGEDELQEEKDAELVGKWLQRLYPHAPEFKHQHDNS